LFRPDFVEQGKPQDACLFVHCQHDDHDAIRQQKFMEASSPLKKGGVVVTRNSPGQGVETVLYTSSTPGGIRTTPTSTPPANKSTADKAAPTATSPTTNTVDSYPYPDSAPPLVAQTPNVFQIPNLGYAQRTLQRPSWFGQPVTTPNSGLCDCSPPGLTNATIPAPADTAPTIQFPQSQVPTTANGTPGSFWDPQSIYSAKNPSPLVKFKNMPPGTYLGQGIVGQPKAYVDGQPFRNLFRYFLLF
jgi:hypothetical protein